MTEKNSNVIGKAVFSDYEGFKTWFKDNATTFYRDLRSKQPYIEIRGKSVYKIIDNMTDHFNGNYTAIKCLDEVEEYRKEYPMPYDVLFSFKNDDFDTIFILYGTSIFVIPAKFLDVTMFTDYSDTPLHKLRALGKVNESAGPGAIATVSETFSKKDMTDSIATKKRVADAIMQEMEDVKNAKQDELAVLQKEIDEKIAVLEAKKNEMLKVLNEKKAEMELKMRELQQQLFVMETEIYGIRCYLGETVKFLQIKRGEQSPVSDPVVLFQKVRYLDEELGKLVALYDVDFRDAKYFEKLLSKNESVLDVFCGSPKCISLVRVSKSNTFYNRDAYDGMLYEYRKYHGTTIGIIVRNGDNVYIGWTDDEKININEDVFLTPDDEKIIDTADAKQVHVDTAEEVASRYFIFSILQGILETSKLIELPEAVSFMKPSLHIVFSTADRWLADNRYGLFSDIVAKCNEKTKVGNDLLFTGTIRDGRWDSYFKTHSFNRDHNYSRRTHDCSVNRGSIYKANLIEDGDIYVSVEKEWQSDYVRDWLGNLVPRKRRATANFQVNKSEFINLSYMNSLWISYVIVTKNLGGSKESANYAEMIEFLNTALAFCKQREVEERDRIILYCPLLDDIPEWQVKLSEWKLANGITNITEYQAKRFANSLTKAVS